jgi:hypothetical protein
MKKTQTDVKVLGDSLAAADLTVAPEMNTVIENTQDSAAPAAKVDVPELVKPGKKGVTNAQMIPALREAIIADDKEKLALIKATFPQVYDSSVKYLNKADKAKLETFGI